MTKTTNLEHARAIVAELRELMKDPVVFRTLGETFFDDAEPCEGHESAEDVIDAYGNGEIIYTHAVIYFAKMPMILVEDEDERKLLYGEEAKKAVPA